MLTLPTIADGHWEEIKKLRKELSFARPYYLPHLKAPPDWTSWRTEYGPDRMPAAFVRDEHPDTVAAIRAAFESGQLDPHAKGVSNVQRVPWMINEFMVPVVEKFAEHVETRFKTLEFFKIALRDDIDRARKSVRHFGPRTTLISGAGSTPFRTSISGARIAFGAFSCSGMGSQSAIARIGLRLPLPTRRGREKRNVA
jgi:hypothetical protein